MQARVPVTSRRRGLAWVAVAVALCTAPVDPGARAATSQRLQDHPAIYTVRLRDRALTELVEDPAGDGAPVAPSWSGDGSSLVFARLPCDGCAPEIRKVSSHRAGHTGLGSVIAHGLSPSVSAGRLVFVGIDRELFTMQLDDRRPHRLHVPLRGGLGFDEPRLSPDGSHIAVVRHAAGGRGWIETIRVGARGTRRLTPAGGFANPAWSPDGRRLAFARQAANGMWRICVVNADGTALRAIGRPGSSETYPTWSPDGARLAFVRQIGFSHAIFTIRLDGSGARRLTPPSFDAIEPAWSPRGDEIAFVVNAEEDDDEAGTSG
jgi:Tol biopolymer transport system component